MTSPTHTKCLRTPLDETKSRGANGQLKCGSQRRATRILKRNLVGPFRLHEARVQTFRTRTHVYYLRPHKSKKKTQSS
jgi:hypothetical protein